MQYFLTFEMSCHELAINFSQPFLKSCGNVSPWMSNYYHFASWESNIYFVTSHFHFQGKIWESNYCDIGNVLSWKDNYFLTAFPGIEMSHEIVVIVSPKLLLTVKMSRHERVITLSIFCWYLWYRKCVSSWKTNYQLFLSLLYFILCLESLIRLIWN